MRKLIFIMLFFGLLGCRMNNSKLEDKKVQQEETDMTKTSYAVSSYLNENEDMKTMSENGGIGTAEVEFHTLEGWAEKADLIILGSIISLDSAETVLREDMKSSFGYTLGTLFVQETYKGESQNGNVLKYLKNGGVITMAQFDDASLPEELQKRKRIREETGNDKDTSKVYLHTTLEQDIQVEDGKTYLLALDYVEELDRYFIIGFRTMSKETDLPQVQQITAMDIDTTTVQVKNNDTGTYEDLALVLEEMNLE